jgi:hypothetical protein
MPDVEEEEEAAPAAPRESLAADEDDEDDLYISAVSAGQEIVWMRSFLGELGYSFEAPSLLLVDNQSAVQVARNPEHHGRMKHLDLRFFWLRDMVNSGVVAAALPQLGLTAP